MKKYERNLIIECIGFIAMIIIFITIISQDGRHTQCWNYGNFYGNGKENDIFCALYTNTNFGNGGEFRYIGDSLDWRYEYDCKVIDIFHIAYGCTNGRKVIQFG